MTQGDESESGDQQQRRQNQRVLGAWALESRKQTGLILRICFSYNRCGVALWDKQAGSLG